MFYEKKKRSLITIETVLKQQYCACNQVSVCCYSSGPQTMEEACLKKGRDHWCHHYYTPPLHYHKTFITSRSLNQRHQTSEASLTRNHHWILIHCIIIIHQRLPFHVVIQQISSCNYLLWLGVLRTFSFPLEGRQSKNFED